MKSPLMNYTWFCVDSISHLDTLAPIYHAPAGNSAVGPPVLPWAGEGCVKQWFSGFHGSSSIWVGVKNQGSPEEMLGVNSFNRFNDVAQYKQEVEQEESRNGKEGNWSRFQKPEQTTATYLHTRLHLPTFQTVSNSISSLVSMVIAERTQLKSTCYSHTTGTLPWCCLAENCLSRYKLFLSIICLPVSPAAPAGTVSGLTEVICAHTQQASGTIKDKRNVLA